jgi:ABC-2 type transport system ATP-binding protein
VRAGTLAWQGDLDELKESVVRLNISTQQNLPAVLPLSNVLSQRVSGGRATAVVTHWSGEELGRLRQLLDADIEVEFLGLEDLFVEFHA